MIMEISSWENELQMVDFPLLCLIPEGIRKYVKTKPDRISQNMNLEDCWWFWRLWLQDFLLFLRSTPAPAFDILPMFTCTLQMLAKVEQGRNNKSFRIKQVSYRNQSWLPKKFKTFRSSEMVMLYLRSWQFRFPNQHYSTYRSWVNSSKPRMEAEDEETRNKCQLWKPKLMRCTVVFSDVDLSVLISRIHGTEAWFTVNYNIWLVVSTILKNISQREGLSHILWKIFKKNVWNHQPDMLCCWTPNIPRPQRFFKATPASRCCSLVPIQSFMEPCWSTQSTQDTRNV